MGMWGNQSGVSKYTILFILVVLGIGFREGIKYLDVQLDHQSMRDTMQAKAAAAQVFKDEELRGELETRAIERDLPLKRENFLIMRDEEKRRMVIKTGWTTEVQYLWGLCGEPCTQKYVFEIVVDEAYAGR